MRNVMIFLCLTLISIPAIAEILTCDALKTRVDAKLQAKGIPSYTLEIVPIENANNSNNTALTLPITHAALKGKEVGTCEGGTKRLIYTKGN